MNCPDCGNEMTSNGKLLTCIENGHDYSALYLERKKEGDSRALCNNEGCEVYRLMCNEINCEDRA